MRSRGIYRGEGHDAVGQEIIVERGEIGPATFEELQCRLDIQAQGVRALNGTDDLF